MLSDIRPRCSIPGCNCLARRRRKADGSWHYERRCAKHNADGSVGRWASKAYQQSMHWKQKGIELDLDTYNTMFLKQGGCCAICGRHQEAFTQRLAVDHDHSTGAVRGLLCASCNNLLGRVENTPELIRRMEEYLQSFQGRLKLCG